MNFEMWATGNLGSVANGPGPVQLPVFYQLRNWTLKHYEWGAGGIRPRDPVGQVVSRQVVQAMGRSFRVFLSSERLVRSAGNQTGLLETWETMRRGTEHVEKGKTRV